MEFCDFRDSARPSPEHADRLQSRKAFKKSCKKAAKALQRADVLVVVTGAGFSADSGLAVYADVANVPAYRRLGLTYQLLCQPQWLETAPELFYGFWGQCFNDYRDTKPHKGYGIIAKWRDDKVNTTTTTRGIPSSGIRSTTEQIREIIIRKKSEDDDSGAEEPSTAYPVKGPPAGAFFCFTSNVDAHWFDHCQAQEIHECHGNVELWQCADPDECPVSGLWRAPVHHRFAVHTDTMEAPPTRPAAADPSTQQPSAADNDSDSEDSIDRIFHKLEPEEPKQQRYPYDWEQHRRNRKRKLKLKRSKKLSINNKRQKTAVIGHTLGIKNRTGLLQHMPASAPSPYPRWCTTPPPQPQLPPSENWPKCARCWRLARPAILMFQDMNWLPDQLQNQRWRLWQYAVFRLCRKRANPKVLDEAAAAAAGSASSTTTTAPLKVCILEIGCGMNVPTCRVEAEQLAMNIAERGGDPTLVRINPDFPLASLIDQGDDKNATVIPIMSRGLVALEQIDRYYNRYKAKAEKKRKKRQR